MPGGELAVDERAEGYDGLPVAVVVADRRLRSLEVNDAWRALFGDGGALGDRSWLDDFDAASRERAVRFVHAAAAGATDSIELPHGPDADRWVDLRAGMSASPGDGRFLVVAVDVTERKRRELDLSFDATHDPLTGVQNRAALLDKAEWAIARLGRQPSVLAALFVDLDHFKDVNDRHGHVVGDRVLAMVAERLAEAVRPADVLGRVGGDEFVVLCEALNDVAQAQALARRLEGAVAGPLRVSPELEVTIGVTVGLAVTARSDETAVGLIDRADRAMYESKRHPKSKAPLPAGRDGLLAASRHLSSFQHDLRDEWTHSLRAGDENATRRWLVASGYVSRAAAALRDDTAS